MEDRIMVLLALLTVFSIAFTFMYIIPAHERKRCKKLYDSAQIGDKYIKNLRPSNPYGQKWGDIITIIDKRMNEDGIPYVKYLASGRFERSESLIYLIEYLHYEPYNNQDKKQ